MALSRCPVFTGLSSCFARCAASPTPCRYALTRIEARTPYRDVLALVAHATYGFTDGRVLEQRDKDKMAQCPLSDEGERVPLRGRPKTWSMLHLPDCLRRPPHPAAMATGRFTPSKTLADEPIAPTVTMAPMGHNPHPCERVWAGRLPCARKEGHVRSRD